MLISPELKFRTPVIMLESRGFLALQNGLDRFHFLNIGKPKAESILNELSDRKDTSGSAAVSPDPDTRQAQPSLR